MKLGIEKLTDVKRPVVILVRSGAGIVGCIVDAVVEVLSIKDEDIERSGQELPEISMACIQGVARFQNRPMILLLDSVKATTTEKQQQKVA
jgi:chemotaxis signal transduction protein